MVLGGGGYTIKNVARLWAYETSVILNENIANDIPFNDYYRQYEANDYKLHLEPKPNMENKNTREGLDRVLVSFFLLLDKYILICNNLLLFLLPT